MEVPPSEIKPNIRGEIAFSFDGQDVVIRPTFQSVMRLEQLSGRPLLAIARDMSQGTPAATDIARVLVTGMNAAGVKNPSTGREYTTDEVGEVLLRDGMENFYTVVVSYIGSVMRGGKGADKANQGK